MYWFTTSNENGPGFNFGQLLVVHGAGDTIAQIAWDYSTNKMVFRTGNPPEIGGSRTWNEWKQIATATPPQEFDLPLAEGWTAWKPTKYWKTQENIVTVVICIRASESHESGSKIGTLPAGFRPASNIEVPATIGSYSTGTVQIMSGGTITFWGSEVNINGFVFVEFSFVSAS